MGHNYIGTEHILLGLIREGEGVAAQVLQKLGADLNRVRQTVIQLLSGYTAGKGEQVGASQEGGGQGSMVLDQFGRNLTQLARDGKLEPVIGRRDELKQIIRVLLRKQKNNPVLVGEAGVGKTSIIEGLAAYAISDHAPPEVRQMQIVEIPIASLVAGAKYRGDMEELSLIHI